VVPIWSTNLQFGMIFWKSGYFKTDRTAYDATRL
jgi:hypothetical protein